MKKLLAIALLSLAATFANAAGSYALTVVTAYNPFSPTGTSVLIGPVATGGSATVDGLGNVSAADIQFSFVALFAYNYTGGVWSTVVGGTSVGHAETCVESFGVTCSGALSGLSGIWNSTQQNGGTASNGCSASAFFGTGNCDRASIVEVPGVSLTIIEQSEFAIAGLPSGFIYSFVSDADNDGIVDTSDNCRLTANPLQQDANADGYGNICDADINNSGTVTTADFGLLRARLGTAPGSSGLSCAGTIPCPGP